MGSYSGMRRIFSEFSLSEVENEFDIVECVVDRAINTVNMIYRYDRDYPAILYSRLYFKRLPFLCTVFVEF